MLFALALTGPTASGKTALSINLARELDCEIISLDSMQIYKGMDIGTAKATPQERAAIKHHMLDIVPPNENYSAESYRADALACAGEIALLGKIPLFVGGTGLYLDTLMRGASSEVPESSAEWREELLSKIKTEEDITLLWERLYEIDPAAAEKTHKNNVRRVARALEIYERTGRTKSYFDEQSRELCPDIRVGVITLDFHDRDNLYSRIDKRVDLMIAEGLEGEVRGLYEGGLLPQDSTASQAIGYKEIISYIKGECTLEGAVEKIKLSSRRYAKRQLTWFRHESEAARIYVDREDGRQKSLSELSCEISLAAKAFINKR